MSDAAAEIREHLHHFGGRPCVALANTIVWRRGEARDLFGAYGDVLRWSVAVGTLAEADAAALAARAEADPAAAERALARVRGVRELLYRVFAAVAADEEVAPDDLRLLNDAVGSALAHAGDSPAGGGYGWVFRDAGGDLDAPASRKTQP